MKQRNSSLIGGFVWITIFACLTSAKVLWFSQCISGLKILSNAIAKHRWVDAP